MKIKIIISILPLFINISYAEIYKCPLPDGSIIFSQNFCANGFRKEKRKWINIKDEKNKIIKEEIQKIEESLKDDDIEKNEVKIIDDEILLDKKYNGNKKTSIPSLNLNIIPIDKPQQNKKIYTCLGLSKYEAYSLMIAGHTYLDRDGDGHPCEWGQVKPSSSSSSSFSLSSPDRSKSSNCYIVREYRRKNGTYVSAHTRCR